MTIEAIIARWGVAAVFAGAMLEGETAVIAGGLIAHQGLIAWPLALAAAALGSFLADQFFFAAGRRYRDRPLVQRWIGKRAFAKALQLLERYPTGFIFAFRFLYGFRTVSPIAIGTSQVPASRFLAINGIAAFVWAALFTGLGYWFGEAVTEMAGRLRPSRHTLLMGVAVLGGGFALFQIVRWWRTR
ncbi:DedA family protein [Sphingomonas jeddahensis]|uniref:Inner membrane protein YohD n=1 Tax=Sphingomonas jeddahensis TaxID=1915074 RepID=A0A1V2EV94_9SPHN|nr:DedA family protein [Sphingomonas jeddahensis]ONF96084.1 Inner membrane protein YohD [Sphingomonas jeddahensis]